MTSPLCLGITRAKGASQLLECVYLFIILEREIIAQIPDFDYLCVRLIYKMYPLHGPRGTAFVIEMVLFIWALGGSRSHSLIERI